MCENCQYYANGECPFEGDLDTCLIHEDELAAYDIEYTNEWEGA